MRLLRRVARASTWTAGLILLAVSLTACSSGSGGGAGGATATPAPTRTLDGEAPVVTLKLDMRDIAYSAEELRAPAGSVFAIEFRNRRRHRARLHDRHVRRARPPRRRVATRRSTTCMCCSTAARRRTLLLKAPAPGSITFWCTIAGHREVGMEGVLVIE